MILVWRIARALYAGERVALAAAWIFAFEPLAAVYSVALLSETLFLFLFLLALDRLIAFLSTHRLGALAVSGLSLAAAAYVRPIAYYLSLVLAAGLLIALRRVPSLRWKAPAVLPLYALALRPPAPPSARGLSLPARRPRVLLSRPLRQSRRRGAAALALYAHRLHPGLSRPIAFSELL